ncbi:MAG: ribosome maturation factor RimM [Pseudothermotoga sp.]
MKEYVVIGKIVRTHGLMGNVRVQPLTNVLEVFDKSKQFFIMDESRDEIYTVQVEDIKRSGKTFLIKFYGVNNEETAKKIVGLEIVMKAEDLPKLSSPDEFYYYEVLNIDVFDQTGNFIGKICDIISTGSNEVLVVRGNDEEILLPMIRDYVVELHKKDRLIVRIPEWI